MKNPLTERPWLLIAAALGLFVAIWIVLLVVAERHQPQIIPVPPAGATASESKS